MSAKYAAWVGGPRVKPYDEVAMWDGAFESGVLEYIPLRSSGRSYLIDETDQFIAIEV